MIVPLFVGREKSINALEEVMRSDKHILLAAQKNAGDDDPATDAIYQVGTLASVLQLLKLPDGTVKVLVEGTARARDRCATPTTPTTSRPRSSALPETPGTKDEIEALVALGGVAVRELREAQQEDLARGARHHQPDRRLLQARRHDRLAPGGQDLRQAGRPRDHRRLGAAGARLHADGERDLRAAGREEDPLARQAPDGEDAARVLSERADEGHSEGAGRLRTSATTSPSSRRRSRTPSCRRKPATRLWPS